MFDAFPAFSMPANTAPSHRSAVLLLFATAVMWSLGGVLVKSIEWPSMAKAGARSAIACLVLWSWLRRPKFSWRPAQLGAALAYAATVTLYVLGNDRTTAANTIFLQYTGPIYVALLSPWVLGERIRRSDWLCISIALAGIALFFRDQFSPRGLSGIFCALGSGLAYGTMIVLLRLERDASPASALLLGNMLTAAVGLPFAIGHPLPAAQAGMLVLLGVVQLGIPYLLFSIAIRRVTALEAVLLPMLEPILNPLWVALARGEWPGRWSLVGGALVLGAVMLRGRIEAIACNQPATQTATAGKNSMPSTTHS
jgi:drug/metabolite transporter (DMT)-like permease